MPHDSNDHTHAHSVLPSDPALRVNALETLLMRKGLIDLDALDAIIDTYQNKIGPQNGAMVVARAWSDSAFCNSLFSDTTKTVADLGFYGRQGEHIVALQNTDKIQNICLF